MRATSVLLYSVVCVFYLVSVAARRRESELEELKAASDYACSISTISDAEKCGTEVIENGLICGWHPCTRFAPLPLCPDTCLQNKTCEQAALCKFRLRAEVTGFVTTASFDGIEVGFEYISHEVTQGSVIARHMINLVSQTGIVEEILRRVVSEQVEKVQAKLDEWKLETKEMLARELGREELFGPLAFIIQPYLGNPKELVQSLLPNSNVAVNSNEDGAMAPVVEVPNLKTVAATRLCHTSASMDTVGWRLIPWLLIAGCVSMMKYHRFAIGIAAAGLVVSTGLAGVLCESTAPSVMSMTNVTLDVDVPQEVRDLGFVDQVHITSNFVGAAFRASFGSIPEENVAQVLKEVAIQAGDEPGNLPIKIADGNIMLHGDGPQTSIVEGSWFDLDIMLDARCAPRCDGCSIFRC